MFDHGLPSHRRKAVGKNLDGPRWIRRRNRLPRQTTVRDTNLAHQLLILALEHPSQDP
jgi:hypothetical protein